MTVPVISELASNSKLPTHILNESIQFNNDRKMVARIPMLHLTECVVYQKLFGFLSHDVTQFVKYFTNFKWNGTLIEMPNIFIARIWETGHLFVGRNNLPFWIISQ